MEKHYDFSAEAERLIYDDWESCGAFRCGVDSNKEPYTIMMPPPNVTGRLHIGHALDNTLQDILVRYRRMRGFDCLWLPGTDHAGIATQSLVSKQLFADGVDLSKLSRENFLNHSWNWKDKYGNIILQQLRRLGASCDWNRTRFTMDKGLSRSVRYAFLRLYGDNLIYRAERLVNWDPQLKTAISDLEVRQQTVLGKICFIDYPLVFDKELCAQPSNLSIITIATMRPETLFGDVAVAVHPDDDRYKHLVGHHCSVPLTGRKIPIIADVRVDRERGTGALKITPAHDFLDFDIGRDHSLAMISVFDKRACLNDKVPGIYRGLSREQARSSVVAALETQGLLREIRDEIHSVPHGERSGVALEPRLTKQWFIGMGSLAKRALQSVENGNTILLPQIWHNTWRRWLENIQPWCISRQLWWGHRIPIWYTQDGKEIAADSEEAALEQAQQKFGKNVILTQDEDVLDTWFSSALWPFSTLGWADEQFADVSMLQRYFPTNVLVTGFDILFFWVARMMMMSLYFMGQVPFKVVYMHALIRDTKGRKMSKSLGNVVNPIDLMNRYGCDALRLTLVLQSVPGRDLRLSEKRIEGNRNFITKLWNSARFLEMQDCCYDKNFDITKVSGALHRWMLVRLLEVTAKVERALDDKICMFHEAGSVIYHFVWDVFCGKYLEMLKPIFSFGSADEKVEARLSSAWLFYGLLRILHPFVPFVTEKIFFTAEIFSAKTDDERLIIAQWLDADSIIVADDWKNDVDEVEWILGLIGEVRSLRSCLGLVSKIITPLRCDDLTSLAETRVAAWATVVRSLAGIDWMGDNRNKDRNKEKVIVFIYDGFVSPGLGLPLGFEIEQAKNRVSKQFDYWSSKLKVLNKKFDPEGKFVKNAPENIVSANKLKHLEAVNQCDRLARILADL